MLNEELLVQSFYLCWDIDFIRGGKVRAKPHMPIVLFELF